jgi:hypothetical protein
MEDRSCLKYFLVWTLTSNSDAAKAHISTLLSYMDYANLKVIKSDIEESSSWIADSKITTVQKFDELIKNVAGFKLQLSTFETVTKEVTRYVILRNHLLYDESKKEITVTKYTKTANGKAIPVSKEEYEKNKNNSYYEKKTSTENDPVIVARIKSTIEAMKSIESYVDSMVNKG